MVYEVYGMTLQNCLLDVREIYTNFKGGSKPASNVMGRRLVQQYVPMWAKEIARRFLRY